MSISDSEDSSNIKSYISKKIIILNDTNNSINSPDKIASADFPPSGALQHQLQTPEVRHG